MDWLKDLRVLVLGLGDSGLAMARWCARFGAQVSVWDSREHPPQGETLARELPQVQRLAELPLPLSQHGFQLVLKSPGLAPTDARVAPALQDARDSAIALLGELELFVRALADLQRTRDYKPQVLAITGTNGKTTTTAMTAMLVERAGKTVATAGNIGPSLLDTLTARLDDLPQVWVLELSSFQLDVVRGFEPAAAALLNITQDHLDWHGDMAAYAAAKARIFGPDDGDTVLVVNRDDPRVEALLPQTLPVKGKPKPHPRNVVRFGLDAPRRPGDFGIVVENGMAWLVRALPGDPTIKRRSTRPPGRRDTASTPQGGAESLGRPGALCEEPEEIHLQRLMPADALRIRGRHNAANALAALALASAIGCPLAPLLHALRDYGGEPHRVELVARIPQDGGEVEAYDDSKGTNVGATVAALTGLGADKLPSKLVVILGGDGKGQDFAPLAAPLARHARAVATIGRDAERIEAAVGGAVDGLPLQRHESLEAAVAWCFAQARAGDAVLLSPACASLDMFRNYTHRADVFVAAVQSLAADRGVV